jgi:hypothetical protein
MSVELGSSVGNSAQERRRDVHQNPPASGRSRRSGNKDTDEVQVVMMSTLAKTPESPRGQQSLPTGGVRRVAQAIADAWRQNVAEIRLTTGDALAANVVLSVRVEGNVVDLDALAADEGVERQLLATRNALAEALERKGLRLRRLRSRVARASATWSDGDNRQVGAASVRGSELTRGAPRRSFIKVIA